MRVRQAHAYFDIYARHVPDAPEGQGHRYYIRFPDPVQGVAIWSDDTMDLWDRFWAKARVRKWRAT